MTVTLEDAIAFAAVAHRRQVYGRGPYILHPLRVMQAVSAECRIVAVLHDCLEDHGDLPEGLDPVDEEAVELLTRPRNVSYERYIDRIAKAEGQAGEIAREVKLADLRDNLSNLWGPKVGLARRYREAVRVITESSAGDVVQRCRFCGQEYGLGECCPDCMAKCQCRWYLGAGPNLKCPIHGLPQHRLPPFRGMN